MADVDMQEIKTEDDKSTGTTNAMDLTATGATGATSDPLKGDYTWTLHNFSSLPDKLTSETFELGGYTWSLLLFPRGNKGTNAAAQPCVSLYLAVPDADTELEGWQRSARFTLTIVNQKDPSLSHSKDSNHTFHKDQNDWGFTSFCSLAELTDPSRGLCVDDTVILRVEVTVTPPDDIAVPSSRATTGFVGLENQGATCYMNSLLQTLYNVNAFRKAVYAMPTSEDEDPANSMPLALQCVFFKLQFTQGVVSTRDLTSSFGWDTVDAFQQHDVQELNRILCDRLEEKMKGTRVEGTVNRLFEGHTLNYIDCINIDYKSQRKEAFQDLQLDVKGCPDIYASFDKYCEVETLEGDNKYDAEGHGKQDARKGVLFESLPPVLSLHLKRFEYDFVKDTMIKINDRYEFPEELDLDRLRPDGSGPAYLAHTHEGSVANRYRLLAVLVHSGGVHGGHYYAYIRPDGSKWLKFDDDMVSVADKQRAVDDNYGDSPPDGDKPVTGFAPTQLSVAAPTRYARAANAYMLVYVRESEWNEVMCEVTEEDVSEHVRARLRAEEEAREARRRERAEAHMYTVVRIATDKDLGAQIGHTKFFDLVDFDGVELQLKMRLKAPFREVIDSVAGRLGVPLDRQRYWRWGKRGNDTWRALEPLPTDAPGMTVSQVCAMAGRRAARAGEMIKFDLFLEQPHRQDQPFLDPKINALVFFKRYVPETQRLEYAGQAMLPLMSTYNEVSMLLRKRAGFEENEAINIYEEVKCDPQVLIEEPLPTSTLAATKVEHGDIFILQKPVPVDVDLPFPRAIEFMQHVRNRVPVTFRKVEGPLLCDEEGSTVQLELLRDMKWNDVSEALAKKLGLDHPLKLRFTLPSPYTSLPRNVPARYTPEWTLEDLIKQQGATKTPTIFYEPIDLPLPEFERLVMYRVAFHNAKHEETAAVTVRVLRDQTIGQMLEEIRAALPVDAHGGAPLRLMEVYQWKIWHMFDPALPVEKNLAAAAAATPWHLRVEVVPEDQRELDQEGALHVHCLQVEDKAGAPGTVTAFSDPFVMAVGPTETVGELKERVRVEMGVPEKEFAAWKVVAVTGISMAKEELTDDVVVATRLGAEGLGPAKLYGHAERPMLGFLHENKNPRKTQTHLNRATAVVTQERALKIRA